MVVVAGAILLLQGASLGKIDEVAQAEPLAATRTNAPVLFDATSRPKFVATTTVAPAMMHAPQDVISCSQPPVGTFGSGSSDAGCMRTTLGDAGTDDPKPTPMLAPVVASAMPAPPMAAPTMSDPVMSDPVPHPASPARPFIHPFVATLPSVEETISGLPSSSDNRAPTVTAAISGPVQPRVVPVVRDAVSPPRPLIKLTSLDKSLTGRWTPRTEACTKRGRSEECLPLIVGKTGARAGPAACRFSEMTREGTRWKALAACSSEGERWTAHVRLSLVGKRLTWTSERGTQDYSR